jgi:signal transduction histidine kinase
MRILFIFFLAILSFTVNAQIDSLLKLYPKQKGEKQVLTLSEISYQYTSSDPDKAIHFGKLAYDKVLKLNKPDLKVHVLNDWSIAYLIKGNYDSVLILSNNALKLCKQLKDTVGMAKALNKLANANFELGNYSKSLQQNLSSLSYFEQLGMDNACGQMYVNVGVIYEKFQQFDEALIWYEKVAKLSEKLGDSRLMLDAYGNRGIIYMKQRKHQLAEENYAKATILAEENGEYRKMAIIYQNRGVNARMQKQHAKGIIYYKKALNVYQKLHDETGMSLIYVNLGQCYIDLNDGVLAEQMLIKGLNLAKKSGSLTQLRHAYNGLSRLESMNGNFEKADEYLDNYASYMDSIYSDETIAKVSEMQVKYKSEQQEKELLQKELENDRFRYWLMIALISVIALILLVFVLLFNYRWKVQSEKLEGLKKMEEERGRIARDLHDHLGAELTLIASKIDIVAFNSQQNSEKSQMEELSSMVRSAGTILRETVWSIQHESINPQELVDKLKTFAERFENTDDFEVWTKVESHVTLLPNQALNLYRIGQEAMTNAFKYAGATSITCSFIENELSISDNGKGFDLNTQRSGFGIQNMQQRAKEITADFQITSSEQGTHIKVVL